MRPNDKIIVSASRLEPALNLFRKHLKPTGIISATFFAPSHLLEISISLTLILSQDGQSEIIKTCSNALYRKITELETVARIGAGLGLGLGLVAGQARRFKKWCMGIIGVILGLSKCDLLLPALKYLPLVSMVLLSPFFQEITALLFCLETGLSLPASWRSCLLFSLPHLG